MCPNEDFQWNFDILGRDGFLWFVAVEKNIFKNQPHFILLNTLGLLLTKKERNRFLTVAVIFPILFDFYSARKSADENSNIDIGAI